MPGAHLDVQLVDPDRQVGVRVQVEVVHRLLDAVEDLGEGLVLEHAGVQRAHLQVDLLLDQQEVVHLAGSDEKTKTLEYGTAGKGTLFNSEKVYNAQVKVKHLSKHSS